MKLTKKQTRALDYLEDNKTNEVLFGGSAGPGKSALGCYWQLKRRIKYPGTRGLIGRAELKILKETTLKTFFEIAKKQELKRGLHFDLTGPQDKENPNCIVFVNGSIIFLRDLFAYPSDPEFDSLGSLEITDAFVDECSQISHKAITILKTRIRYGFNKYGLIRKILYATNPTKNWLYYEIYQKNKRGELPENIKMVPALIADNPHAPESYVNDLRTMPDGPEKRRLYYGDWEYDDDPAALISYEKIADCFSNDFETLKGEKYITADIARLGSDKIVIGIWDGWRVKIESYTKERLNVTGEIIENLRIRNAIPKSNVLCDEDGVGGGIVDFMGYKGFVNNSSPLNNQMTMKPENFNNLKSQCYFKLAERINKNGLYIECEDLLVKEHIIQELEQVKQYNMDKDGKRQILPKDKVKEAIGRSPDYADMLMMREWFELAPKFEAAFF